MIENDPLFRERVNVNFAQVIGENHSRLIGWERGAGLTQACGTGACATAVAAIRRKLMTGPVTVSLPGGDLLIGWTPGGSIRMTGPATSGFEGEADWSRFGCAVPKSSRWGAASTSPKAKPIGNCAAGRTDPSAPNTENGKAAGWGRRGKDGRVTG